MKLVGKKIYRVAPLKCFKQRVVREKVKVITPEEKRRKKLEETFETDIKPSEARKGRMGDIESMRGVAGKQAELAEGVTSGKWARGQAEASMRANIARQGAMGAAGGRGQRALARGIEAGQRGAAAQGAGQAAAASNILGQAGQGFGAAQAGAGGVSKQDLDLAKSNKTSRIWLQKLIEGKAMAEKGYAAQLAAAQAGSKCFAANTKISTPAGQVYIKDIKIGDEVLSFNDEGQISVNIVSKVFEHEPGDIYKLSYWGGEVLVTPNHWILESNNTFLQVDKFNTDHCLVDEEGSFRPFKSLEFYELDKTYNFTVENNHTYIANGIRVHNGGGGKAEGGEIYKKYAKGGGYPRKNGKIKGAGTETSDSIRARLSDGEFVVNAKTVRKLGEALGAEGHLDSRHKGSAYLYALQNKYGDKKSKDTKGLLPVKKFAGGGGWGEIAKNVGKAATGVAKSGILGKGAKLAGETVGAALDHEEPEKKKKKEAVSDKSGAGEEGKKHGGQIATGKDIKFKGGVKSRKKFLDSIGYKPFKHFEDKVEKDFKEGQTGYKSLKNRQKSTVPGFDYGASIWGPILVAAAVKGMEVISGAAAQKSEGKRERKSEKARAEGEAAKSLVDVSRELVKTEEKLEKGGKVQTFTKGELVKVQTLKDKHKKKMISRDDAVVYKRYINKMIDEGRKPLSQIEWKKQKLEVAEYGKKTIPIIQFRKRKKAEEALEKEEALVKAKRLKQLEKEKVERKDKDKMTGSDWAKLGISAGTPLLKGIADSRMEKQEAERKRQAALTSQQVEAARSYVDFAKSMIGTGAKLKEGGKVSFKDILKARKKMGY